MKQQSENWKRELWLGDNLPIMRGMNSETVDLIYLDPPFNSRRIYKGTPDSAAAGQAFSDIWHDELITEDDRRLLRNRHPHCTDLIEVLSRSHGREWQAYLSYIGIRLAEMHRILRKTGSIYLHCDPKMSHPLKMVMDIIFGQKNFRNEIVWHYRRMPTKQRQFQRMHDIILFHSKDENAVVFNALFGEFTPLSALTIERARLKGYNANLKKKMVTVFDWEKYRAAVANGDLPDNLSPKESQDTGPLMNACWTDIPIISPTGKERTGWATQKPVALLERIIKASSNEGDVVLDPFCGCATACIAAERLKRQWIGMDVDTIAAEIMQQRMKDDTKLAPEWGGVRIIDAQKAASLPKRTDTTPFRKTDADKRTLYERQNYKCASGDYCLTGSGTKQIEFMEFDRKLSGKRGGDYTWDNVHLLCSTCNGSKGAKTWNAFIKKLKDKRALEFRKDLDSPEEE